MESNQVSKNHSSDSLKPGLNLYEDALKSTRAAGLWAIILGVLTMIANPLLAFVIYTQANSGGATRSTTVIAALVEGLVIGAVFAGLGFKLRRANQENIKQVDKTLLYLSIFVLIVMVLSFISGGRGVGLIDIVLIVLTIQARGKISKATKS